MIRTRSFLGLATMVAGFATQAGAMDLEGATVDAWQEYLRGADASMQARLDSDKHFLWADEAADRALRIRNGEIVVAPLVGHGTRNVPNGLIHHWIGAVLIPNTTIEGLLTVVHDYDRYKEIFQPVVTDSRSLACDTTEQEFSMLWQRHVMFVNAAMQGHYRAHDHMVDAHRGYSIVDGDSIQEIKEYGHPSAHLLPPDTGSGFMWRIHSISRFEERDGGVYLEVEAMALTRDIPGSLRWMVSPVVNRLSISSLTTTLSQTRQAVATRPATLAMHEAKEGLPH
jgi:hypothetical protein